MQEYKSKFGDVFVSNMGNIYPANSDGTDDKIGFMDEFDTQNLENYLEFWRSESVPEDYPFWCPALWD
jgi:hypothetical protein